MITLVFFFFLLSFSLTSNGQFFDESKNYEGSSDLVDLQYPVSDQNCRDLQDTALSGLYLVLTSDDVEMQEFCRAICRFHSFTFPSIVGATVPYVWIGSCKKQCPICAHTHLHSLSISREKMKPPNGEVGIDGMISVITHELAEVSSNPMLNGWYGGGDATAPTEIADLCLGVYGSGGGGYMGSVYKDRWRNVYNVNGVKGRSI